MTRFEKLMLVLFIEFILLFAFALLEDMLVWKLVGAGAVVITQAIFVNAKGRG